MKIFGFYVKDFEEMGFRIQNSDSQIFRIQSFEVDYRIFHVLSEPYGYFRLLLCTIF